MDPTSINLRGLPRFGIRPAMREASTHLFAVGQTVRMRRNVGGSPRTAEIYHVTSTLPAEGDLPQYRIRSDDERHDRVTTQDNIEAVDILQGGGMTLIERTFGHGQGTAAQQSRNQEAETGKGVPQA